MKEPKTPDELNPRTLSDLKESEDFYQRRVEWRDYETGTWMGSVLFPRDPSEEAVRLFHYVMTECGEEGVEYAQEGLHQDGEYFDKYFVTRTDSFEQAKEELQTDIERYRNNG